MSETAKDLLRRAVTVRLLSKDQAYEIWRQRQARHKEQGLAPPVDELAVELGFLTVEQARSLRVAEEKIAIPRELAGYRILERVGSGSMGAVYKARQVSLDRLVAIKVLNTDIADNEAYVERFLREARAVARLNHPNVISGIDVGEAEGVRYFVMEFASGTTVGNLLERGGAMDEDRVARIAVQIARGLEHAHEAGLVHRDVKPDNILLTKDGIAKLCDLGLAHDSPESGVSVGTPNYISPEQATGESDVDIRSDLYSFGATLYHMLTGQPPFAGTVREILVKHLSEKPQPPGKLEPDVSEEMEKIVLKLMQKDPAERYQSPKHLIGALEQLEKRRRKAATTPRAPQRSTTRRRRPR